MRALMIAAAVAALTCSYTLPSSAQTSQQALMKSCNSDATAKKLKGDERKSFMSDCLAGKTQTSQTPPAQPTTTAAQTTPQATQQQRMKECNANATSQKLKGNARKDFMSSCLSGGSTATTAPAPASQTTTAAQTTAPSPQASQQQRMKECNANATSQKLKGNARKDFMSSCLSGSSAAASTPSTSVPPAAPSTAAKPEAPAATRTIAAPGAPVQPKQSTTSGSAPAPTALGPGQYATEAQAKTTCASDTVVWVNTDSHIYHFKNAADYGKTKQGAYMCERDAVAGGSRAAKNEKRS